MNGWPALYSVPPDKLWDSIKQYESTWRYIPSLLVVGALNPVNGKRWTKSAFSTDPEGSFPELYAPGDVVTANGEKSGWPDPNRDWVTKEEDLEANQDLAQELGEDGKFHPVLSYYKGSQGTSDGKRGIYLSSLSLSLLGARFSSCKGYADHRYQHRHTRLG